MESALNDLIAAFIKEVVAWALGTLRTLLTWWMSDSAYNVQLTGEKNGALYVLREHINWLTAVMAFAGFLVAAFRIAIQRKGEPLREALSQFLALAIIVFTLATAVNLANMAGDGYSNWILKDAMPHGNAWVDNWNSGLKALGDGNDNGGKADTAFILLAFAFAAAISTAIQFGLMLFRSGVLIILVGVLPAVAASRFSSYGNAAYRRCIGWLISFILYKPVAATIYAAALKLMAADDEADRLFGLALVAGAVFALPATMRAIMPGVAEDNAFFGIRQVGHFTFGGTAVNVGKGAGIWTHLSGIGGGRGSGGGNPTGGGGGGGGGGWSWGGGGRGGGSGNGGNPTSNGDSPGGGGSTSNGDSPGGEGSTSNGDSPASPSGANPPPSNSSYTPPSYTPPPPPNISNYTPPPPPHIPNYTPPPPPPGMGASGSK